MQLLLRERMSERKKNMAQSVDPKSSSPMTSSSLQGSTEQDSSTPVLPASSKKLRPQNISDAVLLREINEELLRKNCSLLEISLNCKDEVIKKQDEHLAFVIASKDELLGSEKEKTDLVRLVASLREKENDLLMQQNEGIVLDFFVFVYSFRFLCLFF